MFVFFITSSDTVEVVKLQLVMYAYYEVGALNGSLHNLLKFNHFDCIARCYEKNKHVEKPECTIVHLSYALKGYFDNSS